MPKTNLNITGVIKADLEKIFTKTALEAAGRKLAKQLVKENQKNITDGVDVKGRRFGSYTYDYKRLKGKLIKGKMKGRGGKGSSKTLRDYRRRKTPDAARKVNDKLRLTGELYNDIAAKHLSTSIIDGNIIVNTKLFIKPRSKNKARGLQSTTGRNKYTSYAKKAWLFFGLSSGSRRKAQQQRLLKSFLKSLEAQGVGRFKQR